MIKRLMMLTVILLFVVGCQAAAEPLAEIAPQKGGDFVGGGETNTRTFETSGQPQEDSSLPSYSDEESGGGQSIERMVIRNADLSIVVEDPSAMMDDISRLAADMGGYVVSSNLAQVETDRGVEVPRARITIRVPAENLDQALEDIKAGAGRILSESVSGQDVTREYTDLQSRLRHLENTEEKLTEIMDEARDTEDVLQVYNRLVNVQEEIEMVKGQMQYFEQSARLSSISVTIQANEAVQPLEIGGWQPVGVAKNALQALINTLQFLGDIAIWLGLFVLPVLLILYFPVRYGWKGLKRLFRSGKKKDEEPEQES